MNENNERDVLATRAPADLEGLTRWEPAIHAADAGEMKEHAEGQWLKLSDVQSLLATTKQAGESSAAPVLAELRGQIKDMQEAAYTFGDGSAEAVRVALDGVLDAIDELAADPATPPASPVPVNDVQGEWEAASEKIARLEESLMLACRDLAAINEALNLDPEDAGAGPILDAIVALQGKAVADWSECERISDLPAVDAAMTNFSHDSTGDNAVGIVKAVLEAHQTASPSPVSVSERVPAGVRLAGAKMANTMFNLAQQAGEPLDDLLCDSFKQMQKEWDAAIRAVPPAAPADDSHSFKNFHRSLCERFGYVHDERDWRRDQVSLIEHIAKMAAPADQVRAAAFQFLFVFDALPGPVVSLAQDAPIIRNLGAALDGDPIEPDVHVHELLEQAAQIAESYEEPGDRIRALIATPSTNGEQRDSEIPRETWLPVTGPGQVKANDKLRFKIGDNEYHQRAKLILHPGTDKEEVIYNKKENFYFITAMVLSGFSNHKNVEFLRAASNGNSEGGAA